MLSPEKPDSTAAAGAAATAAAVATNGDGDTSSQATKTAADGATVSTESPSSSSSCPRMDGISDNILDAIGNTPLVRLHKVGADLPCELLVKCEYLNPGGSVKDRIGRQMVLDAEAAGTIRPGVTLIEGTSGNTGIGEALCCAVKGYRCIITISEKMAQEKVDILNALGAEIVRTPMGVAYDAPESIISVARRLHSEIPNSHILDQFANPSNPKAHYIGTAEEILRQTGGKVDMLVAGAGTGGTITGIGKRLKEHNPNIKIVGVDPEGSIMAVPDSLNDKNRNCGYHVEGIGYDFIPNVLDRSVADVWYKSNDKESFLMMRQLIRYEGLLCGGSSGAAVSCALRAAKDAGLTAGQRCVIILPDSVRNYTTKALSDDWMSDLGFVDGDVISDKSYQTWWAKKRVSDLPMNTPLLVTSDVSCKEVVCLLKKERFDQVAVLKDGDVVGVVTEGNMTTRILSGRCRPDDSLANAGVIYKTFHKFTMNDTLEKLASALDHAPFALILTEQQREGSNTDDRSVESECGNADTNAKAQLKLLTRSVVAGIVTRIDLLHFISGDPF